MSETFLQMSHITKRFPGVLALSNVDFALRKGEVHALLGENGAGKSTLMKILSGVYQPDEGDIIFEGQPVTFANPLSAQNAGITIIHQSLTFSLNSRWKKIYLLAGSFAKIIAGVWMINNSDRQLSIFCKN